jgi:cytochrome b subunit of formate dehydrogenase
VAAAMDEGAFYKTIKKAVAWTLLAVTILFLMSGFGIVYPDLVGLLTLGLLNKGLSIRLHDVLWAPFVSLLAAHLLLRYIIKP